MLIAGFGRGTYVYAAYSFYRQLPAGIAGAWRLWANLLAIPLARIRERVALLRDVSLFSFMAEAQLEEAARLMYARHEPAGATLCRQGDTGDEMFIITQGEVEVIREKADEQHVIRRLTSGPVGEFAVLASAPRSASLRTANEVHLLVIKGDDFRALMHRHPQIAERVIQVLVGKLTSALG
jgi:voltage-gated potassium channel